MGVGRFAGLTAVVVVGAAVLTGCSPGVNGVAGIGFDDEGRLIGAVKVCHSDTGCADLVRGGEVASWHRTAKGHGTETWRLTDTADGRWVRDAPPTSYAVPSDSVGFRVDSWGHGWYSSVDLTMQQLTAVRPGHLIVKVDGPPDPSGYTTEVPKVIAIGDLAEQPCPSA